MYITKMHVPGQESEWAYICVSMVPNLPPSTIFQMDVEAVPTVVFFCLSFYFFSPSNYIPPTHSVLYITNSQKKLKKCANYLFSIMLWVSIRLLCTEVSNNFMNNTMGFL